MRKSQIKYKKRFEVNARAIINEIQKFCQKFKNFDSERNESGSLERDHLSPPQGYDSPYPKRWTENKRLGQWVSNTWPIKHKNF